MRVSLPIYGELDTNIDKRKKRVAIGPIRRTNLSSYKRDSRTLEMAKKRVPKHVEGACSHASTIQFILLVFWERSIYKKRGRPKGAEKTVISFHSRNKGLKEEA